jgi:purine-nucleoside phosphorylase
MHSTFIEPLSYNADLLDRSVERIQRDVPVVPALGVIAGSGIATAFEEAIAIRIPFADLPVLPRGSVAGHRSELLLVHLRGKPVLVVAGRLHVYEGFGPAQIALPVVLLHALGIRHVLLTNAAGGLRDSLRVSDLVASRSIVNMTFRSLAHDRHVPSLELRTSWQQATLEHAISAGIRVCEGTYVAVHGPSYETRAEVRLYRMLGDCIGMSTVHEAQAARLLGMDVVCVSVITNILTEEPLPQSLSHQEVLAAAASAHTRIRQFTECALIAIPSNEH